MKKARSTAVELLLLLVLIALFSCPFVVAQSTSYHISPIKPQVLGASTVNTQYK